MCGIAGLLGLIKDRQSCLNLMVKSLTHRGPDEQGFYYDDEFAGGMQRLAINGIKDGSQPLYNKDKSIVLFYNGEIYNYKELKTDLIKSGVVFRTHSDGEVIVHLYEKIGLKVFEKLDGMFAVSIWNKKTNELVLARDLAGEKPLYYSQLKHGRLGFGSEVKALEKIPELSLTFNHQGLWDFPTFLWIPEPDTAFNEIKALPKGSYLVAKNGLINIKTYSSSFITPIFDGNNYEDVTRLVRKTTEEAIESCLLSDVPIGGFLSGGLDSTIVSTIAAKNLKQYDTFTIGFEDINDPHHGKADESLAGAETAKLIGSRHHKIVASSEYFRSLLDDFCFYGDLPWSVSSGLGIMAISKAASELGIKVLLNGDGADEAFGGYSWYKYLSKTNNKNTTYKNPISFNNIGLSVQDRVKCIENMSGSERALAWHYYAHEAEKKSIFSRDFSQDLLPSLRFFEGLNDKNDPIDYIKHDRDFYFPNEMLRKADRMTMAYSVEGRTPFASPKVQSLVNRLEFKHMYNSEQLKWTLRNAFQDVLPMEVINRPKHGFNVPIDHWLKNEWFDLVEEAFSEGSSLRKHNIVQKDSLEVVTKMLNNNSRLNGHTVFSFIMLNKWMER